jgi:hypothetical protein
MSNGALEVLEKFFPVTPEQLREARILSKAQDVIPDYFTGALQRTSASLSHEDSDADDAERAWGALLDDLELEMARRAQ